VRYIYIYPMVTRVGGSTGGRIRRPPRALDEEAAMIDALGTGGAIHG
jgi:hypothetical protein